MRTVGWTLAVVALAVGTGVWMSRKPWIETSRQKASTRVSVDDMKRAQAERARLTKEAAILESPAGREAVARERGYQKPDEVPVETLK